MGRKTKIFTQLNLIAVYPHDIPALRKIILGSPDLKLILHAINNPNYSLCFSQQELLKKLVALMPTDRDIQYEDEIDTVASREISVVDLSKPRAQLNQDNQKYREQRGAIETQKNCEEKRGKTLAGNLFNMSSLDKGEVHNEYLEEYKKKQVKIECPSSNTGETKMNHSLQ